MQQHKNFYKNATFLCFLRYITVKEGEEGGL
nr:MAG TPA: hypothetical protein [Bacteriophage sp.]